MDLKRTCALIISMMMCWWEGASINLAGQAGLIEREGLDLPAECILGETCWVANYVDVDPADAALDFHCNPRTYNGHEGTDFAIRDLGIMVRGVPVVASAAGIVRSVRDGMVDVAITNEASRAHVKGRECGNGVIVEHEGGWQTQYCHLRRGSVRVERGQPVERGAPLGLVGLSGETEFPHVHLMVRHHGEVVDPFTGQRATAGCGREPRPVWRPDRPVPYEEVALYHAGFSDGTPNLEAIRSGLQETESLSTTSPALVLWVDIFGVEAGDQIRFRLISPDGKLALDHDQPVGRAQARRFAFAGARRLTPAWVAGLYTGEVTLTRVRDGQAREHRVIRKVTLRTGQ